MSEVDRQVVLDTGLSEEISSTSFDFNHSTMPDRVCVKIIRFIGRSREKVILLLSWPSIKQRTQLSGYQTASCLAACLTRAILAKPARWYDLERLCGLLASKLSKIFRGTLHRFISAQADLSRSIISTPFFMSSAAKYAESVFNRCGGLENVVAFIDRTVSEIARPNGQESSRRTVYNGHKRKHAP